MANWKSRLNQEAPTVDSSSKNEDSFSGVPFLISNFLKSRGFKEQAEVEKFLKPKLSELRDPKLINGIEKATQRLIDCFKNNEGVCIYADFDLDGTSGLALFKEGLEKLGFKNVYYYQPKRLSQGYGFHKQAVDDLKDKVKLIVTVDVGITANETVDYANAAGIDTIITDHHLPQEVLPKSYVIVNPNVVKDHPLSHLSGAGVAFYLLWSLSREMTQQKLIESKAFDLKSVLDCFVIGTLTDMVPVKEENRVLIKHGLLQLAQTQRVGLKLLLKELGLLGRPLTSQDVAIRFAPKLNALSRLENGILPVDVFLIKDEAVAQNIIADVIANNSDRQDLQHEAEKIAADWVLKNNPENHIFVCDERFHKGVVGLVATKLAQSFKLPAFVGSINEDQVVTGSARRPENCDRSLVSALGVASEYLNRFGGHAQASGFEFHLNKFEQIKKSLFDFYQNNPMGNSEPEIFYDLPAKLTDVNEEFMKWFEHLGPFGESFQSPLFLFQNVQIKSIRNLKGGHLRISLTHDSQTAPTELQGLYFSPEEKQIGILNLGSKIDILGEPQRNYYQGKKSTQILIKRIRVS